MIQIARALTSAGKILAVHSVHQDYDWQATILGMMRDGVPN